MIKKTLNYVDFEGNDISEDYYFNLSKMELMELEASHEGGFGGYIDAITKAENTLAALNVLKEIVYMAVGKKSDDGKRFIKSAEIIDDFKYSPAADELFMELLQNAEGTANFINGILPPDLAKEVAKEQKKLEKKASKE